MRSSLTARARISQSVAACMPYARTWNALYPAATRRSATRGGIALSIRNLKLNEEGATPVPLPKLRQTGGTPECLRSAGPDNRRESHDPSIRPPATQHRGHWNTQVPHARDAAHLGRINGNTFEVLHPRPLTIVTIAARSSKYFRRLRHCGETVDIMAGRQKPLMRHRSRAADFKSLYRKRTGAAHQIRPPLTVTRRFTSDTALGLMGT